MEIATKIRKMKKRDGRIVDFEPERIAIAAGKALKAAGTSSEKITRNIVKEVLQEALWIFCRL